MSPQRPLPEIRHSPEDVLQWIWQELALACSEREKAWRLLVISTISDGEPQARTVVLRDVIPSEKQLLAHADWRSPKIQQMLKNPITHWTFTDGQQGIQLRVRTVVTLHTHDELANEQWRLTPIASRKSYLSMVAPGSALPVQRPVPTLPEFARGYELSEEELQTGRPHFCVICGTVTHFDWYDLDPAGHVRLQFTWADQAASFQWVAP